MSAVIKKILKCCIKVVMNVAVCILVTPTKELDIGQNFFFCYSFLFALMNNILYDKTFTPISDMETSDYFEPNKLGNKY